MHIFYARTRRQIPAKPCGEDVRLRTSKTCGPGARCWCQVGGEFACAPGIPCTLFFWRETFSHDPGRFAPQDREAMFAIRGMVESKSRSVLDAPRSLGMTEIDDLTRPFRRTQSRARRQTGRRVAQ